MTGKMALSMLAAWLALAGGCFAQTVAPVVVRTEPAALANDVDASLNKITVTFDQPMLDKSWSWTGGGETFPNRTGDIFYDDAHTTCTMPVKLEPGKVYWVGVNSPSHKNFKSTDGEPAKRYVILFATRSADGKPTPIPEDWVKRARRINRAATNKDSDKDKDNDKGETM
ncbi:MAG: Ig-like domain-containing domain [Phycisphaerales bacterium]